MRPRPCTCERETCRLCFLYHNDERYNRHWGGQGLDRDHPGFASKAWTFGKALISHVSHGMKTLPKEKQDERLKICHGCPLFDRGSCRKCGCNIELKASWVEQRCPEGKWPY
jgi:Family of unknown function (DUF6171)